MKIAVVIATHAVIDPLIDVHRLGEIGSTWASWHQWHQCQPNNLVCYDSVMARRLADAKFATLCNLYVPGDIFQALGEPAGVRAYAGKFSDSTADPEEIIAIHLASAADITVLIGFDWGQMAQERAEMLRAIIAESTRQWVVIASAKPAVLQDLAHVHADTLENLLDI